MDTLLLLSTVVVLLSVLTGAGLLVLAWRSRRLAPAIGLRAGRLRPCPSSPNAVCSEPGTPLHAAVPPLGFNDAPGAAWDRARRALIDLGGRIERDTGEHLWATFRSRLLGFVDDVELRRDDALREIHVRSASRVGHHDFGLNRRRVAALRAHWQGASVSVE